MTKTRAGLILTAAVAALLLLASPAAAQYDGETGTLETSNRTVAPGGSVTVSGSCFEPDSEVEIAVGGKNEATTTADSQGAIDTSVRIPGDLTGNVEIAASGRTADGTTCVLSTSVNVTTGAGPAGARASSGPQAPASAGSSTPNLPITGTEITPGLVLTALGLLAVGIGMVVVARRRRSAA